MKLLAFKQRWGHQIEFILCDVDIDGKIIGYCTLPTVCALKPEQEGEAMPATFSLNYHDAQILIDSLWDCGLRPSEGSGSAGALLATQKHLGDMRKLVFESKK